MEEDSGKCSGIRHPGVVKAISGGRVTVSIISQSACASCHVKNACSASDTKEKSVEVDIADETSFSVGDEVDVIISQSNGYLAVLMSYLVPVIIIFAAIITATNIGYSEIVGALCGLLVMGLYFTILYFLRKKIDKKLVIEIVSKKNK